jgi:dihydroorotate dehydrogenase
MYRILRKLFFQFDPEKIHYWTTDLLRKTLSIPGMKFIFKKMFFMENESLKREVAGLTFKNPVGLAAGFDKTASMYNELYYCGFGFIEIGTITPKPQDGNDKPRLFRLTEDQAIINRMGFNNEGVEQAIFNLKKKNVDILIGGNIGKNKLTSNEDAKLDYEICFDALFPYVDYFVVNVSSPNTPNLRDLQDKEPLTQLLSLLQNKNTSKEKSKPIFLKIAPDLTDTQLDDIVDIIQETQIAGVIATNTTIERSQLKSPVSLVESIGAGGVSGKPLTSRSTEVVRYLATKSNKSFAIIGVGGIHSEKDALEKLKAGADLIQLYTGFIYEGPGLVKRINKAILKGMN